MVQAIAYHRLIQTPNMNYVDAEGISAGLLGIEIFHQTGYNIRINKWGVSYGTRKVTTVY